MGARIEHFCPIHLEHDGHKATISAVHFCGPNAPLSCFSKATSSR